MCRNQGLAVVMFALKRPLSWHFDSARKLVETLFLAVFNLFCSYKRYSVSLWRKTSPKVKSNSVQSWCCLVVLDCTLSLWCHFFQYLIKISCNRPFSLNGLNGFSVSCAAEVYKKTSLLRIWIFWKVGKHEKNKFSQNFLPVGF